MESSTIQPPNKGPSFNIILIVIVIGVIIFFVFLNKPSQPTTTMIPRTTMMPITTRIPTPTISPITYFKIEDPAGVASGKYKSIPFNQFGLNDKLNNWTINIIFITTTTNNLKYQGIIGNTHNNEVVGWDNGRWTGAWGFWIYSNSIHFRIEAWDENFPSLGTIHNNIPYKLIINFNNGIYKLTLINMNTNTSNTIDIKNKPKLNSTTGFITIGGHWQSTQEAIFDGSINYVDFTSIPTSSFKYELSGNSIWATDDANTIVCPYAPGSRKELGGWCTAGNENDAKNLCNIDPTCIGYVTNNPTGFQLTKKLPVPNTVANGKFYKKITNESYNYPIAGTGLWAQDGANEFSCADAPGRVAEIGGWCAFRNENDAKNRCNLDPDCIGYVSNAPDAFQLTKKQPVPNTVANGTFYKKTPTTT
jgi:hypothetical protein